MDIQTKSLQKPVPMNIDAEQAVLGAILLDNTALFEALEYLEGEDFYRPSHRLIFEAMYRLITGQKQCDLLTLKDELDKQTQTARVGGPAYLAALIDQVPTAANISTHAKIVHEKATSRRLLNVSLNIASRCYDDQEAPNDLLEDATQQMFAIASLRQGQSAQSVGHLMPELETYLQKRAASPGAIFGLPTGLHDLDQMTTGFEPSDLITIAAWPGEGKTAFALEIALHNSVLRNVPGLYMSLEMSSTQLLLRLACMYGKLNTHEVRLGQISSHIWEEITRIEELMAKSPLFIDETPGLTAMEIRLRARKAKVEHDIRYIIIDHIGLVSAKNSSDLRANIVAENSRQMKALAKELNVPVISLCQLRKKSQDRNEGRPQTSDLKDSGGPVEDSDIILLPYRPEQHGIEECEGMAEIIIGKQRNGPLGSVKLAFLKESARFVSLARHYQQQEERIF